ncbi:unnamed protein product [Rhizophagus irregularis]|nr:unnamed protein product [Rhizophagus irregularis]CAB4419758.1 unnamed protein product [Rhizophagus irregularis]
MGTDGGEYCLRVSSQGEDEEGYLDYVNNQGIDNQDVSSQGRMKKDESLGRFLHARDHITAASTRGMRTLNIEPACILFSHIVTPFRTKKMGVVIMRCNYMGLRIHYKPT